MKKIISVALVLMMVFAVATVSFFADNSPETPGKIKVSISTEGDGTAASTQGSINPGDTVTLTASNNSGFFTKWIINGDYTPVEGTEYSPVFTIAPTTDITAVASFSVDEDNLTITTQVVGKGTATADPSKVAKGSDATVTLTATEDGDPFVTWSLACEYEIVEGSLTSKTLVIKPYTDVVATAKFGDAGKADEGEKDGANKGNTSPATGDFSVAMIALVLMAMGLGVFAVKKIKE